MKASRGHTRRSDLTVLDVAVHESARGTFPDVNALNRDVCFASINGYREPDLSRPKTFTPTDIDASNALRFAGRWIYKAEDAS